MEIIEIPRYCATNSYVVRTPQASLLIDTGFPSTLHRFNASLKQSGLSSNALTHMMATHYHPDHIGLMPTLLSYGVTLVTFGEQARHLHDSDAIFARDPKERFNPIDDRKALSIPLADSRAFLASLGIDGEVVSLPSHSADSVGMVLDTGEAFVGDLTPLSWINPQEDNPIARDWKRILRHTIHTVYYGHAPKGTP